MPLTYTQKQAWGTYLIISTIIVSSIIVAIFGMNLTRAKADQINLFGATTAEEALVIYSTSSVALSTSNNTVTTSNSSGVVNASVAPSLIPTSKAQVSTFNYKNGQYTSTQTYFIEGSNDTVEYKITINGDIITSATATLLSGDRQSNRYVSSFNSVLSSKVVNKKLSSVSNLYVSGASLTSDAFTDAINDIKSKAAS